MKQVIAKFAIFLFVFSMGTLHSQIIRIPRGEFRNIRLHWLPRGKRLIPSTNKGSKVGMSIIYDEYSGRQMPQNGRITPLWSADERQYALIHLNGICVKDLDTLQAKKIGLKNPVKNTPENMKYLGQKPPGIFPEIFACGLVSTFDNVEFAGTFSPDFSEYFFTRRRKGTIDNRIYHMRLIDGRWTDPVLAPFGYDCFEFEPHITPTGDRLFYGSRRPLDDSEELDQGTRIWISEKTDSGWSEPKYMGPPFDEAMFVCMARDGTLYNSGLSKSENMGGDYGPWEMIAPHLYGPYMHPCVGPDESYIIFDTEQYQDGLGKSLLISFRKEDGSWGDIISFRKLEQFQHFEQFGIPMLTPDGKYLFFSSDGDIYWVDAKVIEQLGSE